MNLLELYDRDQRQAAIVPGLRREELPNLVRLVDLIGHSGVVIYSKLSADSADTAIEEQMAYFSGIGQEFEWKAFAHDQPPDLVQRLGAHGFEIEETEAVMVLDLQAAPSPPPTPSVTVRRLTSRNDLQVVASIKERVYGGRHFPDLVDRLGHEMENDPRYLSIHVAYVDGVPAGCGWIRFPGESIFASLWGGATVPELRNRGLYSALLVARLQEARQRGRRYVTVDAGHMSRPILEKRGFQLLTHATACMWHG